MATSSKDRKAKAKTPPIQPQDDTLNGVKGIRLEPLFLRLLRVEGLPKPMDCFLVVKACVAVKSKQRHLLRNFAETVRHGVVQVSPSVRWPERKQTTDPVWNSTRKVLAPRLSRALTMGMDATLFLQLFSRSNLYGVQEIGRVSLPMSKLRAAPDATLRAPFAVRAKASWALGSDACRAVIQLTPPPPTRKIIFFIRHGESSWNRAQRDLDLSTMLSQTDHGLDEEGIRQSLGLRDRIQSAASRRFRPSDPPPSLAEAKAAADTKTQNSARLGEAAARPDADDVLRALMATATKNEKMLIERSRKRAQLVSAFESEFLNATALYSSPLTRALQTAMLALRHHPHIATLLESRDSPRAPGITLLAAAREKRNLGGRDTQGRARGMDIEKRAVDELNRVFSLHSNLGTLPRDTQRIGVAVNDCGCGTWWNSNFEGTDTFIDRMSDFLDDVAYGPDSSMVITSHSHFIRGFAKRYMTAEAQASQPKVAFELQNLLLNNCGVAGFEMDFSDDKAPRIVECCYLFDSKAKEKKRLAVKIGEKIGINSAAREQRARREAAARIHIGDVVDVDRSKRGAVLRHHSTRERRRSSSQGPPTRAQRRQPNARAAAPATALISHKAGKLLGLHTGKEK